MNLFLKDASNKKSFVVSAICIMSTVGTNFKHSNKTVTTSPRSMVLQYCIYSVPKIAMGRDGSMISTSRCAGQGDMNAPVLEDFASDTTENSFRLEVNTKPLRIIRK